MGKNKPFQGDHYRQKYLFGNPVGLKDGVKDLQGRFRGVGEDHARKLEEEILKKQAFLARMFSPALEEPVLDTEEIQ